MSAHRPPTVLTSPSGLGIALNANGSIHRIDHRGLLVNLFLGNEVEGGPANLWLRRLDGPIASVPLLGPRSQALVEIGPEGMTIDGEWRDIGFRLSLRLAKGPPAWFWHLALVNLGEATALLDVIHAQDLALADYGAVRLNEYYVSQYVDYTALEQDAHGIVLAVRQNLKMGGGHPWALVGSLGRAVSFATDALQLHGLATRRGEPPAALHSPLLPGVRHQHEHSMAVLQEAPIRLEPGAGAACGFFVLLEADHPAASGPPDLARVSRALGLPEAEPPKRAAKSGGSRPAASLFSDRPQLPCRDFAEHELGALFGSGLRAVEREGDRILSFFAGANRHGVLRAKERSVLRPHGQIFRTGAGDVPDERSLTTTAWMNGVFHSMVTEGHVSINRLLSTTHGYLGLFRSHGQRVFIEDGGRWWLLGEPSAFEMSPAGARWIYEAEDRRIEVRAWAAVDRHELRLALDVLAGSPCRFLISHHIALGGDDGVGSRPASFSRDGEAVVLGVEPDTDLGRRFPKGSFRIEPAPGTTLQSVGGDELLFADGISRGQPFLVLLTAPLRSAAFCITGGLVGGGHGGPAPRPDPAADLAASDRFWSRLAGPVDLEPPPGPLATDLGHWREILPWLAHDAWIHYLAPRGLEQYSGGGWGTRDVCQGPVELLLALGRFEPIREILLTVFRHQNPDGDWPQWFMFFERERGIRPADSHGDIVFWPLLGLARYLWACEDASILDERVPFFDPRGEAHAEEGDILAHVERALGLIGRRTVPGTHLAAFGHGDWNDSLQPVDPRLAERMCSAWTVTLHHHCLLSLARALARVGRGGPVAALEAGARQSRDDFRSLLVIDGVVAGLACFDPDGSVEPLLHPRDERTHVRFSLLPMVHALLWDLFTPEEAQAHAAIIRRHLLGPDGARLFDRPLPYSGGPSRLFQRAESSSHFGREIGVMYMHAHLRYAEAMARLGDAEAFFQAMRQANPIAIETVVASARRRQACCYHSSSDGWFLDRYEASARYPELIEGRVPLEGGWRVYSSGPGIALRLFHECLLGLARGRHRLEIDPVLPPSLDGLCARVEIAGRPVEVTYRVGGRGHGPERLQLNGRPLAFGRLSNPYRRAGVEVSAAALEEGWRRGTNSLTVELGVMAVVELLDDFHDVGGWRAIASGEARLALAREESPHGSAMRLDFDFHGGGGFVVARKELRRRLPASFAVHLRVRGAAPANRFELKLVDPSGTSVWWHHRNDFAFPPDWQTLRIASRDIEFAYGPAGGGAIRELGAIELAIAAGPGGKGSLWFADLRLEDLEPRQPPAVRASSAAEGHPPANVLEDSEATSWRSDGSDKAEWLELDFHAERDLGGLVIDWEPGREAKAFDVTASTDGVAWKTLFSAPLAGARRSYVCLPGACARFLRLALLGSAGQGFGIVRLSPRPESFSRTPSEFFHEIAAGERRGLYPRWLTREQSLWTPVGVDGGTSTALLDEQGMLEPDRGTFSIEPFLFINGRLVTWADAAIDQALLEGWLPIPSSVWQAGDIELATTAFAVPGAAGPVAGVRYRLHNGGGRPVALRFFAAIRPFQVTPPWQGFGSLGGVSPIRALHWADGVLWVNGERAVIPLAPPDAVGVAAFAQGGVMALMVEGLIPARERVADSFGHASGALSYFLDLAPGAVREVVLAVPFGRCDPAMLDPAGVCHAVRMASPEAEGERWRRMLAGPDIRVPGPAEDTIRAMRTAGAHILLNREGPALQPGPRRYTRSWIRDGATMSAALLRLGVQGAVRDFLRWYARYQRDDGNVPCVVDGSGPDWLAEHDSHGQFAFTVAEHARLTGDPALAAELWPAVEKAAAYLARLRRTRLTADYERSERRACFGLLPELASHEGYLAHPVHAYWDDFWALRGLADAAELARMVGDDEAAARLMAEHDGLAGCLYASIRATIAGRGIGYVPGSVEWADFDFAATATAISTTDAAERLPQEALRFSVEAYLEGFRRRRDGRMEWANYSAYEIRIIGALVRLGRRQEAHELLDFFLADRRPRPWNQWPEISWRNVRSPGHLGDLPHSWISAEYVLAVLALFAYEDPASRSLVIAAGIPEAWLADGEPVVVEGLPTWFGPLAYTLRRLDPDTLELTLRGDLHPPGGIRLCPPLPGPARRVTVDGTPLPLSTDRIEVARSPACVRIAS